MTTVGALPPCIDVVIPAWRSAPWIAETLDSLRSQTHTHFRAIVALDGPDPETLRACHHFLEDPRFHIVPQESHVGWVENTNRVLRLVTAPFATILPHDDLLHPEYLTTLLSSLLADPAAACTYSDIACFGSRAGTLVQHSVIGSPLQRQLSLILGHHDAVAFRALFRTGVLVVDAPPLIDNPIESFSSDTLWMSRLALFGSLIRVPQTLYRKRYHAANTHTAWADWPPERQVVAWSHHCALLFAEALRINPDPHGARLLLLAVEGKLTARRDHVCLVPAIHALTDAEKDALLDGFRRR